MVIDIALDSLCFRFVTDEQKELLTEKYGGETVMKGEAVSEDEIIIKEKPEKLYKILYELSFNYDIEIM